MKTILHLCADTGSDSYPYKMAGYTVILVGSDVGVENFSAVGLDVHGVFANPVCTDLSTARKGGKARSLESGLFLVKECQRIIAECNPHFWVIENPARGVLHHYLGEPRLSYQPWQYGSAWTKHTSLWGNFFIPPPLYHKWEDVPKLSGLYMRKGRPKPSLAFMHATTHLRHIPEFTPFYASVHNDMEFRSLCSQGFAQQFLVYNP